MGLNSINIICFFSVLPAIAGFINWQYLPGNLQLFAIRFIMVATTEVLANKLNLYNTYIFNLFMVVDFFLLITVAYNLFPGKIRNYYFFVCTFLFLSAWVSSIIITSFANFLVYAYIVFCLIMTLTYFIELLYLFLKGNYNENKIMVFICAITMIYYCSVIPLFSFLPYILKNLIGLKSSSIYNINYYLTDTWYLLITIGFLCYRKTHNIQLWKEI
jgi:hypothetical protein